MSKTNLFGSKAAASKAAASTGGSGSAVDLRALHELARRAARLAGDEIAAIKHPLVTKKPDGSVLCSADLRSNEIIFAELAASNLPICSEEKLLSYEARKKASYFWLIDPLDGSSNYLKNRKNYCVCIALICEQRPVIGVIYDVCDKKIYSGYAGGGVWCNEEPLTALQESTHRALISLRTGAHPLNDQFIIEHNFTPLAIGSALKFVALLCGEADVYARFDCLNSWDIAAGDFLINEAGGIMLGLNHREINYNRADFGCLPFIALGTTAGR